MGNAFKDIDHNDCIFFVSGVSDSRTTNIRHFNREKKLLLKTLNENKNLKKIIYISTCDIYDSSKKNSLYLKHKLNIENCIKNKSNKWLIFRVSQVIGSGGNKNNLLFKLCLNIFLNRKFLLYPVFERNLIYIDDLKKIILKFLRSENKIINIANPKNIKVLQIVNIIEKALKKHAIYETSTKKNVFIIPLDKKFPYNYFKNKEYYNDKISSFVANFLKTNL